MKFGINLYLWADDMHDGLMPILERLKQIGFDGVEVPISTSTRLNGHAGESALTASDCSEQRTP